MVVGEEVEKYGKSESKKFDVDGFLLSLHHNYVNFKVGVVVFQLTLTFIYIICLAYANFFRSNQLVSTWKKFERYFDISIRSI